MNEITRYNNSLNTIPMRQWTAEEQNFFFAILTQIRDKGTDTFYFNTEELKEFSAYTNKHSKDFKQTMKSLSSKLENLRYREETDNSYKSMVLFQSFEANWDDSLDNIQLEVMISKKFEYIVNQLQANFTQFELAQFTNLRSTYSKTMFRHMKQWRTKGVIGGFPNGEIPKEELYTMLDVPSSMRRANNFKEKVIKPIILELSPLFEGLKIKPIKARKAGNPIIAYKISWKSEKTGNWVKDKYKSKDKYNQNLPQGLPSWTDEAKLLKAGYDTKGMTQNEMYHLVKEKGL